MRSKTLLIASIAVTIMSAAHPVMGQLKTTLASPRVIASGRHDTSPPLRFMPIPQRLGGLLQKVVPRRFPVLRSTRGPVRLIPDSVRQSSAAPTGAELTPPPGQ